jgi:two-component system sensor histidine kinase BarA
VLVADDNEVNREVAKEALQQMGATVALVCDGLEAVAAYGASRFDLIMLDGSMPGLSGFDAARRIREIEARSGARRTPIVAFTARVLGASATEWREAGMDALVAKPLTLEQLSRGVETALGRRTDVPTAEPEAVADAALVDGELLDELSRLSSRGADFLARVVGLYRSHAPEAVGEIERCARDGDWDGLAKAAHALKSMSLNIGANAAAQAAAQLEIGARNGAAAGVERIGPLVAATCHALAREAAKAEQAERRDAANPPAPPARSEGARAGKQ